MQSTPRRKIQAPTIPCVDVTRNAPRSAASRSSNCGQNDRSPSSQGSSNGESWAASSRCRFIRANLRISVTVSQIGREKVVVPATKPFLTFQGAGIDRSLIVWNSTASDLGPDGQPLTAYRTASVTIVGANFIARDISFQNTAPPPPPGVNGRQAAAFRISGDMAAFYNCGFYGAQDTLCDDVGRHYFKGCFIQGSIDFIFGNGRSLYEQCELHSIADSYGSVAAQDRQSQTENTGFSFVNCKVTGTGILYLGRAMGPYSRIVYSNSYFDNIIDVRGWDDWDHDASRDRTVSFGQYKCYGPGATSSLRVPWARELSDMEVTPFLSLSFVDGTQWLPST